jgi:hypothetical protein
VTRSIDTSPLRCLICGRLKPKGARWSTFVDAMRGGSRAICSVACLEVWATRQRDEPAEAER